MQDVNGALFEEPEQPFVETKAERFDRIAPGRMNRALAAITLVGNCANRTDYHYSEADIADMMQALKTAVSDVESRFRVNSPRQEFNLRR